MEWSEVEIRDSAHKHGISDDDIYHALRNIHRYREIEADGELRIFLIGPARNGAWLELVAVPAHNPQRVIHADKLRPKFYDLL